MFWTKKTHFYQNKLFIIFCILAFLLVIFRILLPSAVKAIANNRLAKESPHFSFHINDIDLKILRGKYVVEGITGKMKDSGEKFLFIKSAEADVPWKNIFKGKLVANVVVDHLNLVASQVLLDTAKAEGERVKEIMAEEEKPKKDKDPFFRLNSFKLVDSKVTIQDFMSFKGKDKREITDINVVAHNITPTNDQPVTDFVMTAQVFGPAPLHTQGIALLKSEPIRWDVNSVMKNFDLRTINPFIREKIQAFIHKGKLDFYAEVEAKDGAIEGYLKPFVRKMKMDTPKGGFNLTGELAAGGGNLIKLLLTDSEAKTLATKLPFRYEEKFEYKAMPALQKAVVHRAKQNIPPGLEDNVGQKGLGIEDTMQAEEARPKK